MDGLEVHYPDSNQYQDNVNRWEITPLPDAELKVGDKVSIRYNGKDYSAVMKSPWTRIDPVTKDGAKAKLIVYFIDDKTRSSVSRGDIKPFPSECDKLEAYAKVTVRWKKKFLPAIMTENWILSKKGPQVRLSFTFAVHPTVCPDLENLEKTSRR